MYSTALSRTIVFRDKAEITLGGLLRQRFDPAARTNNHLAEAPMAVRTTGSEAEGRSGENGVGLPSPALTHALCSLELPDQRASALAHRLKGLIGGDRGEAVVEVPGPFGRGRCLDLKQVHIMNFAAVGPDHTLAE